MAGLAGAFSSAVKTARRPASQLVSTNPFGTPNTSGDGGAWRISTRNVPP
jgi:hypothetical protein